MHFTLRRPHPTPRGRGAAVLCCPRCAAPDVMYYPACTVTGRETQETACLPLTTPQLTPRPHTHHLCKVLLVSSHLVVLGSLSRGQFAASPLASLLPFFSSKVCVSSNRSGHCHPGAHHRSGLSTDMSDLRSQLHPGCSPPHRSTDRPCAPHAEPPDQAESVVAGSWKCLGHTFWWHVGGMP